MAGADRVEGTLFGNGERTGNVDIVTLALNMLHARRRSRLDFSDINDLIRMAEYCTSCRCIRATPMSANWSTRRFPARTRTRSTRA